jgi:predicted nucleotidyltransferase
MPFDTHLLDQALAQRSQRLEAERTRLLQQTLDLLPQLAQEMGIRHAYIFGSVVKPHRFHDRSDVDIAVEMDEPARLPEAISRFSQRLQRNVDVVDLSTIHFAQRIREEGILWTPDR